MSKPNPNEFWASFFRQEYQPMIKTLNTKDADIRVNTSTGECTAPELPHSMRKINIRSPYNYDLKKASDDTALRCTDKSLAVQSQLEEADINTLIQRYGLNGQIPQNIRIPLEGDYSDVADYMSCMNALTYAKDTFMQVPAYIRTYFENSPQLYAEYVHASNSDSKKNDQLIAWGIKQPPVAVAPAQPTPTATPVAPAAPAPPQMPVAPATPQRPATPGAPGNG